jgi:hypothetical protein
MSNNSLKSIESIDFVKADISTPNNLDFFIVWSQDLNTLEFTALSLFTDIDEARDYKDRLINSSHKLEHFIIMGYSREMLLKGYIL